MAASLIVRTAAKEAFFKLFSWRICRTRFLPISSQHCCRVWPNPWPLTFLSTFPMLMFSSLNLLLFCAVSTFLRLQTFPARGLLACRRLTVFMRFSPITECFFTLPFSSQTPFCFRVPWSAGYSVSSLFFGRVEALYFHLLFSPPSLLG